MIQKWIKDAWQVADWKTIRQVAVVFLLIASLLLLVFKLPDWKRDFVSSTLDTEGIATLISYRRLEAMSQSETGNTMILHALEVTYAFDWKEKRYVCTENVPNTIKNQPFIEGILTRSINTFTVQFQAKNPTESQLLVN
ncbi:MAG: hypothetical protein E6Q37_06675 [Crocinitomicaceae bacterium]|nr:MAG: hypothetical protein E6Q37_06675 [Crocinitomicaceae bacterium]